jgi:predicted CxxxxCH...CXXCH cytochrome family protein
MLGTIGWTGSGATANDGGGYPYNTNASCSVNICHSDGNGGAPKTANVAWATAKSANNCGVCHNSASDSPTSMTWSPAHTKHVGYGANSNFSCNSCHSTTASNNTTISDMRNHVDGAKTVVLNAWAGGTWNGSSCATVYCHSDGKATPNYVTQAWASTTGCVACHGSATTTNPNGQQLSTPHAKHLAAGTYNLKCATCHYKTADLNNNALLKQYSGAKYHVDKSTSVILWANYSGSWISSQCQNNYCHSNGAVGGVRSYVNQAWSGASNCTMCHGGPTTLTTNLHATHINNVASGVVYTCRTCHATTVSNNTHYQQL